MCCSVKDVKNYSRRQGLKSLVGPHCVPGGFPFALLSLSLLLVLLSKRCVKKLVLSQAEGDFRCWKSLEQSVLTLSNK